jgi:putative addiction module component (TIGR02574 family)
MSDAAAQLMPTLLALPPEVRLELAELLQDSVPVEMDDALRAELNRRKAAHEAGERPGIPAAEMFRRLRAERA